MAILNQNDKKVKEFPVSFSFKKDKIEILSKGKIVGELDDEGLQEIVSTLATMMLLRMDKETVIFQGKNRGLMVSLLGEKEKPNV